MTHVEAHSGPGVLGLTIIISPEEGEKITAVGENLATAHGAPAPGYLPPDYVLPEGTEVPHMGAHTTDRTAPEFNKLPFTNTFIYGFKNRQLVFLEPRLESCTSKWPTRLNVRVLP